MKKRWKKITKMFAAAAVATACMCAVPGVTAFANVNQAEVDAANAAAESEAQAETEALTEVPAETEPPAETEQPVIDRSGTEGDTFSVPGNGEVVDHITDGTSKEFYTIRTANNNTFYMVVDHAASSDNVYMLSTIDEGDLSEFIEEAEKETQKETKPAVILDENVPKEPVTEKVEKKTETPKNLGSMIVVCALAALAGAAYYFLKVRRKKEEEKPQSENLELDSGFETVNEDEKPYYQDEEDQ